MEFRSTDYQEVAMPDQMASGVTGAGQENRTAGRDASGTAAVHGEFFSYEGFLRMTGGKDSSGNSRVAPGPGPTTSRQRKEKLVLTLGVLAPVSPVPVAEPAGAGSDGEGLSGCGEATGCGTVAGGMEAANSCPGEETEPDDGSGDLFFALYERDERLAARLNQKLDRVERKLSVRLEKTARLLDERMTVLEARGRDE